MNVKEVGEEQALITRQKIVKWYVDEVSRRWAATGARLERSDWKANGFDTALTQPNYTFHNTNEDRLDAIAQAAYDHGMGVEIEMSDAVLANEAVRGKYYACLNKGVEHRYMNSFKALYQQVKTLKQAAERMTRPRGRDLSIFERNLCSISAGFIRLRMKPPALRSNRLLL